MIRLDSPANQLMFNTVRIVSKLPSGSTKTGTGFLASVEQNNSTFPFILTCQHCLKDAVEVHLSCVSANAKGEPDFGNVQIWRLDKSLFSLAQPHRTHDVAAIPFGPILNQAASVGQPIFHRELKLENFIKDCEKEELTAFEQIVFVGYPLGLHDTKNALPLLRVGYSASPIWSDFEQEPRFLIDAEVFSGSSGSPVFILNEGTYTSRKGIVVGTRFFFIGMILQSLDYDQGPKGKQHIGLGSVLNAHVIKEYLEKLAEQFSDQ